MVIVDQISDDLGRVLETAAALAPYPRHSGNYYPGLRRVIAPADAAANAYVERLCEAVAPFIAGAFDVDGFDLIEASYSMVTTAPSALSPAQRAPHFDSTDPNYLAILHYLNVSDASGTAFFRQRSTGIEMVTANTLPTFVRTAERDAAMLPPDSGYIQGSDPFFEQIFKVDGVADRVVIYQGSLLHSGIIPPAMTFTGDPRQGRLTANLFVRIH